MRHSHGIVGKSRDQIVGRTTAEVFADKPDLLETILLEDQILINREKPITEALRERVSSDGGTTYESSVKLAIGDSDGAVQYILGVSRNITSHMPLGEGQK